MDSDERPNILEWDRKKRNERLCWLAGIGSVIILVAVPTIIALSSNNKKNETTTVYGEYSVSDLLTNWERSKRWNIVDYTYGKLNTEYVQNETLRAHYPQGSFQNTGGFKFYSKFRDTNDNVCLYYRVKFPLDFNWVKGGKLPGLYIGEMGASGGKHISTGFSYRLMWRQNGIAEAYLYVPENQTQEYYNQVITNDEYGHSLWRGRFRFVKERWNDIIMCVNLNMPNNGSISLKINNSTMSFYNMFWRTDENQKINGLMMHSFFGGSNIEWAPDKDTYIDFSSFSIL